MSSSQLVASCRRNSKPEMYSLTWWPAVNSFSVNNTLSTHYHTWSDHSSPAVPLMDAHTNTQLACFLPSSLSPSLPSSLPPSIPPHSLPFLQRPHPAVLMQQFLHGVARLQPVHLRTLTVLQQDAKQVRGHLHVHPEPMEDETNYVLRKEGGQTAGSLSTTRQFYPG